MGEKNTESIGAKAKNALQDYLVYLLLAFVLIVQTVAELYTVTVHNIFTAGYFLNMATSIASTMVIYILFAPVGSEKESLRNLGYRQNLTKWAELSTHVRAGRNGEFTEFCHRREAEEREERQREIVENNTMIPYAEYVSKFRDLSRSQLKNLKKRGEISPEDYKALKSANNAKKIKPINPLLILCGVEHRHLNDAGRDDRSSLWRWMVKRPAVILITDIVINSIQPIYNGAKNADAIYAMLLSALSTVIAACVGYRVGVSQIREKNEIVKNRIFFIEIFEERCKK